MSTNTNDSAKAAEPVVVRKKACGTKQPPIPADNREAARQALASI